MKNPTDASYGHARDVAVTKLAAFMQIAIGYAGGAVPTDEHAKQLAEPVADALIRAAKDGFCPGPNTAMEDGK